MLPTLAVQHHHAHAAAVMAEHGLAGPVLAVALDGAGYGPDGTVWGGEILRVDGEEFERLGHLRQVRLPGGDRASEQPWRMAVSWLWAIDPEGGERRFGDILARWRPAEVGLILNMLRRGVNSPVTSSCGRLFDAAACLAGIRDRVSYEGQAAIELEQAFTPGEEAYRGEISRSGSLFVVDPGPMLTDLVEDVRRGAEPDVISRKFHNGLAGLWADALEEIRRETGLGQVVLSGGVFQNARLSTRLSRELSGRGFDVYRHRELPPNDACISLGQAWIGRKRLNGAGVGDKGNFI